MLETTSLASQDRESTTATMRLTVLGTRGSIAVSGPGYREFGGASSCYLVEVGDERIILDAGTGLTQAPDSPAVPTTILLSHLHVDHIAGLGVYARLSQPGVATAIYVPARSDEEANCALARLYAPPLWPVRLDDYAGDLSICALPGRLQLGDVLVEAIEGNHPGGCKVIRVSYGDKSLVYATDYEYEPVSFARLVEFAREADLVLFDGQYQKDELSAHRGFGHATPEIALRLLSESYARRLLAELRDASAKPRVFAGMRRTTAIQSADGAVKVTHLLALLVAQLNEPLEVLAALQTTQLLGHLLDALGDALGVKLVKGVLDQALRSEGHLA